MSLARYGSQTTLANSKCSLICVFCINAGVWEYMYSSIHILLTCHVVLFRLDCAVKQDVICIEDQLAAQRN